MEELDKLIFRMYAEISKRLMIMQRDIIASIKMTASECKALGFIGYEGQINQKKLGEFCGIDGPATSRLVERLCESDLIKREKKEKNRKEIYLALTENGRCKANTILRKISRIGQNYFKPLDSGDKEQFFLLLQKSLTDIQDDGK